MAGADQIEASIDISQPAPAGGLFVYVSSSNRTVTVPSAVFVPAGKSEAPLPIATGAVLSEVVSTIRVVAAGASAAADLHVIPVRLNSLASTDGGNTFTVTLTSPAASTGATIEITSSDASLVAVPKTITIPGGIESATFQPTFGAASISRIVVITVSYAGATRTYPLKMSPFLNTFSVSPGTPVGGAEGVVKIVISDPAPVQGSDVTLSSSNPSVVKVPATLKVTQGQTDATTIALTNSVTATSVVTLTARYRGSMKTTTVVVYPAELAGITCVNTMQSNSSTVFNSVRLNGVAPAGNARVYLRSSDSRLKMPSAVDIRAGSREATFTIVSGTFTKATTVTVTATYNGVSKTTDINIPRQSSTAGDPGPPALRLWYLKNGIQQVKCGSPIRIFVTLSSAALAGGAHIPIVSDNPAVAGAAFAEVPAGEIMPAAAEVQVPTICSATVPLNIGITASYGGVTKTLTVKITL
jgi:hypothetical protein